MAVYFFDLTNGYGTTRDEEGVEFSGPGPARDHAIHSAREVAGSDIREGRGTSLSSFITIRDQAGAELARVTFDEALGITA